MTCGAGAVAEWLSRFAGDAQVGVVVRFPDIGWEVVDWAFGLAETEDGPAITVSVRGADFDYPDVVRRLKAEVDRAAYYNFID